MSCFLVPTLIHKTDFSPHALWVLCLMFKPLYLGDALKEIRISELFSFMFLLLFSDYTTTTAATHTQTVSNLRHTIFADREIRETGQDSCSVTMDGSVSHS